MSTFFDPTQSYLLTSSALANVKTPLLRDKHLGGCLEKNAKISKKILTVWSVVHFVITLGNFGAFLMPLRPYKTSYQYPLKQEIHQNLSKNIGNKLRILPNT
jgi:hypothetical protein